MQPSCHQLMSSIYEIIKSISWTESGSQLNSPPKLQSPALIVSNRSTSIYTPKPGFGICEQLEQISWKLSPQFLTYYTFSYAHPDHQKLLAHEQKSQSSLAQKPGTTPPLSSNYIIYRNPACWIISVMCCPKIHEIQNLVLRRDISCDYREL